MTGPSLENDPQFTAARAGILELVSQRRMTVKEAAQYARGFMQPTLVDQVRTHLEERQRGHRSVRTAVVNPTSYSGDGWYLGAVEGAHWAAYRNMLDQQGAPGLANLHDETERIVSLLAPPNVYEQKRKGLVMGNVQSGKTRNFAAVIAKAVDAGYRYVIVLSGINNNLREQTQARLTRDLFHADGWYPLTGTERDFEAVRRPQELLMNQPALCAVVKKNPTRLEYLIRSMKEISLEVRRIRPILIIDDEADQATPNSLSKRQRISTINGLLRDLWGTVATGSYVAYTATPFANILMDPEDEEELFPSDFITTIEPGKGYFGPERVFGVAESIEEDGEVSTGLDMVRRIPPAQSKALRPPSDADVRGSFDPELPESLLDAFHWFVVATAIRRARESVDHSSMLVHTTHYTAPHFTMQRRFKELVSAALKDVRAGRINVFKLAWDREVTRVSQEATEPLPSWTRVVDCLSSVLQSIEIIVDNGDSKDRLNYEGDEARTVVAIGGGTLSRGLTLEGLVVSYFTRTSNTYDTLMQMGRWFGYRPRYEDLPRVWVAAGLDADYAFLARVETDLRQEIASVQDSEFTPREVGVRVRAHPGRLQITAANKMYHAAVAQVGLSGTFNQTFILDGSAAVSNQNFAALESLLAGHPLGDSPARTPVPMAQGVMGASVSKFLQEFIAHDDQRWLSDPANLKQMQDWIGKWADRPIWNVVIADTAWSPRGAGSGETVVIGGRTVGCANRSAMQGSDVSRLDFKAIMSADDRLKDIDPALYRSEATAKDSDRRRVRRLHGDGQGLIVAYPISGNSKPKSSEGGRVALNLDHPVLAFSIFFPNVNDSKGEHGAFISVRPTWSVPDAVEGDEGIQEEEFDGSGN